MSSGSYLLSKTVGRFGKWTQHKIADLQNVVKNVKDAFLEVSCKVKVPDVGSKGSSTTVAVEQQNVFRLWKPQLLNFRTTLRKNAAKVQQQLNYRGALGEANYFRRDFIWRRARNGHLMAFAGLFLFQDDIKESSEKLNCQYDIYNKICSNIKDLFPVYDEDLLLDDDIGNKIDDFTFKRPTFYDKKTIILQAQLKPVETNIECDAKSDTTFTYEVEDFVFTSNKLSSESLFVPELSVKVVLPEHGVTSDQTLLKHSEAELVCCGRGQFGNHDGQDGNWPRKKLVPHPNIVMVERAFIDKLCVHDGDILERFPSQPTSEPKKALYVFTKSYPRTLRSHLKQACLNSDISGIVILQMLEAVAHLERNNVVHRNITSDNFMIDFDDDGYPRVLLGEFGSSYSAYSQENMKVPFQHKTLDTRIGNLSTQPPEVSKALPGRRKFVDYRKADAWSVGAVAYEVLTGSNPFIASNGHASLDSRTYTETQLPSLNDVNASNVMKIIVEMLMACNPCQRLTASEAADILHLELFALPPSGHISADLKCKELRSWLTAHCAEAFARKYDGSVLFQLCQCFFTRINPRQLSQAFHLWMLMKV